MINTIAIVSLSNGTIGEDFVSHEICIGEKRLKDYGIKVKYMDNARKGIEFLKAHPEKRADDLIQAFQDPEVEMILCAIGGDDTFRLLPSLLDNNRLKDAISNKVFLGFSDSTINHLMLNKLGIKTFYGQSFLADVCELEDEMLPYTRKYFEELIMTKRIKQITPSDIWYEGRTDFGIDQVGSKLKYHANNGFELLQGDMVFCGKVLGGCLDTIYDIFDGERYADSPEICGKYEIFPSAEEWQDKILLIETSEEKMGVVKYRHALEHLKSRGVFDSVQGVIVGKPMDEEYYDEYKGILLEVVSNPSVPIVYNINIGHSMPRCIIPFGVNATIDIGKGTIEFDWTADKIK